MLLQYAPGYTAPPPLRPFLEETTIDIGGGWQISGTPMDLNDPRLLEIAEPECQFLEAEYEDINASNASGVAFCRLTMRSEEIGAAVEAWPVGLFGLHAGGNSALALAMTVLSSLLGKVPWIQEFIEGDVSNGASLFAAINNSISKKGMSLYIKEMARNEAITGEDGDAGVKL
ncbi:hypothetical protein L2E82_18670 [Cichorium intybus]|uniref:Uncharacterized protein n=1 Tax=Cichorium intybus TaxID=13427 RepID=A0ACB9FA92_CICIN|nr:hypothetical protein L2E82_18670 [Cichorium intybus]